MRRFKKLRTARDRLLVGWVTSLIGFFVLRMVAGIDSLASYAAFFFTIVVQIILFVLVVASGIGARHYYKARYYDKLYSSLAKHCLVAMICGLTLLLLSSLVGMVCLSFL